MSSERADDVAQLRATAVAVARQLGDLVARMRAAGPGQVETKSSDTDVVTITSLRGACVTLAKGINVYKGQVTCEPVAQAHKMEYFPLAKLLG